MASKLTLAMFVAVVTHVVQGQHSLSVGNTSLLFKGAPAFLNGVNQARSQLHVISPSAHARLFAVPKHVCGCGVGVA